jgi:DNA-binding transcriptional MerR regulator
VSSKQFFLPRDVIKATGHSYRQIQYWDRTGFIGPSYRRHQKYRLYTRSDLILFFVAEKMRKGGYSIQQLRRIVKQLKAMLPQINVPFQRLTILVDKDGMQIYEGRIWLADKKPQRRVWISLEELFQLLQDLFPASDEPETHPTGRPPKVVEIPKAEM